MAAASKQRKSYLIGPAREPNGRRTIAYEARVDLRCAQCGATITAGQLFSRHAVRGHPEVVVQMTLSPLCTTCRPLQVDAEENKEGGADGDV